MKHSLIAILGFLAAAAVVVGSENGVQLQKKPEGYLFTEGGAPVLFYQIERKAMDGRGERSNYVHPLYDLDGEVITEDFPADHIHHRGIYWAWHQVLIDGKRVQDQWSNRDSFWEVQAMGGSSGEKQARLALKTFWESPQYLAADGSRRPFVEEQTVVVVHRREGEMRKIDFSISLRALVGGVQIGGSEDDKGYGGFSFRLRMPQDIRFKNGKGEVTPLVTPVARSPWMGLSASFGQSGRSGVAVLTHPTTAGFPQPWILRRAGSMQNAVYPGRHPVALSTTAPTVLRYRLVLHRGELTTAEIEKLQIEYAADKEIGR